MSDPSKQKRMTIALYALPFVMVALVAVDTVLGHSSDYHLIVMGLLAASALVAIVVIHNAARLQAESSKQLAAEKRELEIQSRLNTVIATHTYDCHFIRDLTGKLIYLSPSCAEFSGYSFEELWAMPDLVVMIHDEDLPRIVVRINRMRGGERDFNSKERYRFVRKDGSLRWVETRLTFIPGIHNPDETQSMTSMHDLHEPLEAPAHL